MVRRAVVGLFTVGCLSMGGAASGRAAEPPERQASPPASLPELLVSATRIPDQSLKVWQFPGNATVITAAELMGHIAPRPAQQRSRPRYPRRPRS